MSYYEEKKTANGQYPFISKDVFDLIYLRLYGRIKAVMDGGVGSIQFFLSTSIPANFCIADGRMINRFKPVEEFGVGVKVPFFDTHGERFGAGDTTNTIQVPDLSDQFLRMNAKDGRLPGGLQSDNTPDHKHASPIGATSDSGMYLDNIYGSEWDVLFGRTIRSELGITENEVNQCVYANKLSNIAYVNTSNVITDNVIKTENRPKNAYLVAAIKLAPEGYDFNWNKITESTTWKEIEHLGLDVMSKAETDKKILATYDSRGVLPPKDAIMAIDYKQGVCSKDIQPIGYRNRNMIDGVTRSDMYNDLSYQLVPGMGVYAGMGSVNVANKDNCKYTVVYAENATDIKFYGLDRSSDEPTSQYANVSYGDVYGASLNYKGSGTVPHFRTECRDIMLESVSNISVSAKVISNSNVRVVLYKGSDHIESRDMGKLCGYDSIVYNNISPGLYHIYVIIEAELDGLKASYSMSELCVDVIEQTGNRISSIPTAKSRDVYINTYPNISHIDILKDSLYMIKDIYGKIRGKTGDETVESYVTNYVLCANTTPGSHLFSVMYLDSTLLNPYLNDNEFNRVIINKNGDTVDVIVNGVIRPSVNVLVRSWGETYNSTRHIPSSIMFDHAPHRNNLDYKYHYTPNTVIGMNILGKGRTLTDEEVKLYSENEIAIPYSADDETGGLVKQLDNLSYFKKASSGDGLKVPVEGNFSGVSEIVDDGLSGYSITASIDANNGNGWISGMFAIDLSKFSNKMLSKSDGTYFFFVDIQDIIHSFPNIPNNTFGTGNVYRANSLTKDLSGAPIEVTWQNGSKVKFYTSDYCYFNNGVAVEDDLMALRVSFFLPLFTREKN